MSVRHLPGPRTCTRALESIWPGAVAGDILAERHTSLELQAEDVTLVEEEYDVCLREKLVRYDRLPQVDAVLDPVDVHVFLERLIEARDRCEEYNRIDVFEILSPFRTLQERG